MANKCVINRNKSGDIIDIDIKNPKSFTEKQINNVKTNLYNRQAAEDKAGGKIKGAVAAIERETGSATASKAVWESITEKWAKENNAWVEDYEEGHRYATQGGEHLVYVAQDNSTQLRKVNHDVDNLSDWYKNLVDFNHIFPTTAYEVVGFTRLKKDYYAEGSYNQGIGAKNGFAVVVRQNFIPNKQMITKEEIVNYMAYMGFSQLGTSNDYKQGNVIIGDLNVDNVIKTPDGQYHVIDAYVDIDGDVVVESFSNMEGDVVTPRKTVTYATEVGDIVYDADTMTMLKQSTTQSTNEETMPSTLFNELRQLPLLSEEEALQIYKQSFSTDLTDWDELDTNC